MGGLSRTTTTTSAGPSGVSGGRVMWSSRSAVISAVTLMVFTIRAPILDVVFGMPPGVRTSSYHSGSALEGGVLAPTVRWRAENLSPRGRERTGADAVGAKHIEQAEHSLSGGHHLKTNLPKIGRLVFSLRIHHAQGAQGRRRSRQPPAR